MKKLIITGGKPLKGSVRLGGAKNASFKIMIATLLAPGESRILNFSHIADVDLTKAILIDLGCKIRSAGERTLFIDTQNLNSFEIDQKFGEHSRASTMFIGPLLNRFCKAVVPLPGGDKIGKRPLDRHFSGLKALGARVNIKKNQVEVTCKNLTGTRFEFAKKSHTGTESMIMAAVLARGETFLKNAAQEPEIDDLIKFLNRMGSKIKRLANGDIQIVGVNNLKPSIHQLMPDRNETVTYACAAIATKGDVIVENAQAKHIDPFLVKLKSAGGGYEVGNFGIRFFYKQPLVATKVTTKPHPGFMTDWQPLWTVLMTQAKGESIVHEAVFTSRFQYVADLKKMGADIKLFNPKVKNKSQFYNFNTQDDKGDHLHAAKITGITPLKAGRFTITDIRAGATMVLAALVAQGKSTLAGTHHIERGYENLPGRLRKLGAKIEEV